MNLDPVLNNGEGNPPSATSTPLFSRRKMAPPREVCHILFLTAETCRFPPPNFPIPKARKKMWSFWGEIFLDPIFGVPRDPPPPTKKKPGPGSPSLLLANATPLFPFWRNLPTGGDPKWMDGWTGGCRMPANVFHKHTLSRRVSRRPFLPPGSTGPFPPGPKPFISSPFLNHGPGDRGEGKGSHRVGRRTRRV